MSSERASPALREAVALAAQVIAHPKTAAWVQKKWGAEYRQRENVFYRMLVVLGLSSYQKLTGDPAYASLVREQAESLGSELLARPQHLADEWQFPGPLRSDRCCPECSAGPRRMVGASGSWLSTLR